MGKIFILVEREEKKQTLAAALSDTAEVLVVPAVAAVVEAKNVDYLARGEEGFLFKPAVESRQTLKTLLQAGTPRIYLAFDSSVMGEYSSWLWTGMVDQLSKGALHCRRLHLASLEESGFTKAKALVEPIDSARCACLYFEEAFQGCLAGHLGRLLGTRVGPGGIPLTMQTIAVLTLLAERDQEVRSHAGTPKWQVELSLQADGPAFPARLQEVFGVCCDGNLDHRQQAKEVAADLADQVFQVVARQENDLEIAAPQPYDLHGLILDAFRYCRIPFGEAMRAARDLFDGLEIDGRPQPLISSLYPLAGDKMEPLLAAVANQVGTAFGEQVLVRRTPAGHAILPLQPAKAAADIAGLSGAARQIYDLVRQRALASQMVPARGTEIVIRLATQKYQLQSQFRVIDEPGFLQIYSHGYDNLLIDKGAEVPQEEQQARVAQVVPLQRSGLVPELYLLPGLFEDLAELGVGGREELIVLLGRLCESGYIMARGDGSLQCDTNLFKVVNTLNRAFPAMQGMNFLVYYGQTIDEVATGRKRFQMALKQFDQNLGIQGKPLVKPKMPTTLPKRLKKSKSIIKGEEKGQAPPKASAGRSAAVLSDFDQQPPRQQSRQDRSAVEPAEPLAEPAEQGFEEQDDDRQPVSADMEEVAVQAPAGEEEPLSGPEAESGEQPVSGSAAGELQTGQQADEPPEAAPIPADSDQGESGQPERGGEAEVFQTADTTMNTPPVQESSAAVEHVAKPPPFAETGHQAGGEVATKPCPQCGRPMVYRQDRFGGYWACTGVPACRHTQNAGAEQNEAGDSCPLCHEGQLLIKRTPTGKDMYVCARPECEFMAWSKPHAVHCPLCTSVFLVEQKRADGSVMLTCPKAGCNYARDMNGSSDQEAPVAKKKVLVRRGKKASGGGAKRKVVVRRRKK
ncbi:MAG: hypothetical protein C0613_03160 [Desulfobulbaceae bacterium]|nr:MAG: hypothetical protein C0613_03160 [Desulfobulbaceae bacterium]